MKALLRNLFGDAIARMLSGAGLSVVSFAALLPVVQGALNMITSSVRGVPGDVASLALMSGFGECVSIIGSAVLTRMAISSAQVGLTKGKAS